MCVVCCVVRRHFALCGLSLVLGIGTGNGWIDGKMGGRMGGRERERERENVRDIVEREELIVQGGAEYPIKSCHIKSCPIKSCPVLYRASPVFIQP